MSRIAVIAGCLVLAATPALAQSKAAAQKNDNLWADAYNKGDVKAIGAMYSADAYLLPDHGEMAHGRAQIEAAIGKVMGNYQRDLKLTTLDVQPLGAHAAREIGTYTITVNSQPPRHDSGKYVAVLRKVGRKWLITTDIWNSNK